MYKIQVLNYEVFVAFLINKITQTSLIFNRYLNIFYNNNGIILFAFCFTI